MFTPPRFVVIDDNRDHLHAIADAIQLLGSVCARVHYQIENEVPVEPFRSVRAIFIDLQLQDRSASSNFNKHYAEIQRILELVINPNGGPFLLVVWTDRPEQVDMLGEYLESSFEQSPHTRPVALVPLSKADHIDTSNGSAIGDGQKLREALLERLRENAAAAALVQWESDVLDASSRVLADLVSLSSGQSSDPRALPTMLKRLAVEAVGSRNVSRDVRSALEGALFPLLQDHLQNDMSTAADGSVWINALDGAPDMLPKLSKAQVKQLNTMLHFAEPGDGRPIEATVWGAVSEMEPDFDWAEFGHASADECVMDLVKRNVRINMDVFKDHLLPVQIRIGAACDYAQKAVGPVPLALAVFIPEKDGDKAHALLDQSTAWISPEFEVGDFGPGQICVDPRYVRVRGHAQLQGRTVVGRLKEQLLLQLIASVSAHGARPGIVRFVANA